MPEQPVRVAITPAMMAAVMTRPEHELAGSGDPSLARPPRVSTASVATSAVAEGLPSLGGILRRDQQRPSVGDASTPTQ
eukprot:14654271-Alexandrium_andersonii.AAC.1